MRLSFGTLLLLLAALPVQAQRASLADRVSALESQAATQTQGTGQANMELLNRTTQMQDEIRALRAIIEQLQNDLEQARQRNREQYIDMDSRVSALEGGSAKPVTVAPVPVKPTSPAKPVPAAAGENAAFQSFLQSYPDSRLAPNAWYWLGESYYATASYELALKSFGILLERFPDSGKTPDAMLKSAYCQLELKNTAQGKQQLERVIALYPEHPVAELARSRLRGLSLGQ
jgi:tol-pal system protein YbgF